MPKTAFCLICILLLSACGERGLTPDDLPTRIPPMEVVATNDHLTAIAPPSAIRESVAFPDIDDNLLFLSNWRSEASFIFAGTFAGTPRTVDAATHINTWYNQVGNRRRVVIEAEGTLFGDDPAPIREGVRLGGDTYLLIDNACYGEAEGDATDVADLRIGDVLGGVTYAVPAGEKAVLHGEDVWRYTFSEENTLVPIVRLGDNGAITAMQGELWVTYTDEAQPIVVRYYVNLQVENVVLRLFESSLPVSGVLQLRYDLFDIGIDPNITPPNGC